MATAKKYAETPLMRQYYAVKERHPDAILLFRMGDFYETFGEDAIKTSSILGITLTRRANGAAAAVELAGFPYHAVDTYLPKLVRAGERVAICEQLEDPKTAKGIVKRGITELITPGVALSDNILTHKENTFLASVFFGQDSCGVAFLDLSTGEFFAAQGSEAYVDKLLGNLSPKEVLFRRGYEDRFRSAFGTKYYTYRLDEWAFTESTARQKLCKQFNAKSLKGFGIDSMSSAVSAAGAILYYLEFTEHNDVSHINSISRIDSGDYVWIDRFTMRNLELFASGGGQSFVETIDRTHSPMGGRMLRRWISMPLRDRVRIEARLDTVSALISDEGLRSELAGSISLVGDLERLASRIAARRILPRELVQLKNSLYALEKIRSLLSASPQKSLNTIADGLDACIKARGMVERHIYPDPSNQLIKGGFIADGVDMELDDLRRISSRGKEVIAGIQQREREKTDIPSLKVSFNNVFGYYIEVSNAHREKVPEEWIRKQTLTSAERYITQELKEYEEKILGAEERIVAIENHIYSQLLLSLCDHLRTIQKSGNELARLDCLLSFAIMALERGYCRPAVNEGKSLDIRNGRHPVIETMLPAGEAYVPNDLYLDDRSQQVVIITGPNMSGKSALLRQTALIVLMAQTGSFVPASSAGIGLVDKIFTRVGASDNISQGESTFMVEMLESAMILNNLSDRSLVLLDEIGRGTSTYDGVSIAWAMVEYIHDHPRARAKTLFATHYHELNELEERCARVKNYNVSVREVKRSIIFMRKLVRGGSAHSFGIHVAKMAGMPAKIVETAEKILGHLEASRGEAPKTAPAGREAKEPGIQLSMFQLDDPVLKQIRDEIRGLDINSLTPLEALNKLSEIKKITGI